MHSEGEKSLLTSCFLIKGWKNKFIISANKVKLSNGKCRQELISNMIGNLQLLVWLKLVKIHKSEIFLER